MDERVPVSAASERTQFVGGKVLTFSVGGDVYAIGIQDIKEIIEYGGVTRVPMVNRQIGGVLNLRGRIVPVVDLAERLQLPSDGAGRRSCVVVLDVKNGDDAMELGMMVSAVNQVITVEETDLQPAPSFGTRIRDDFILSMARIGGEFVVILDHPTVLSIDEMAEAVPCI
jgi:purine-binding chemotaxis protein CheW